jgi:hypothetical protein
MIQINGRSSLVVHSSVEPKFIISIYIYILSTHHHDACQKFTWCVYVYWAAYPTIIMLLELMPTCRRMDIGIKVEFCNVVILAIIY